MSLANDYEFEASKDTATRPEDRVARVDPKAPVLSRIHHVGFEPLLERFGGDRLVAREKRGLHDHRREREREDTNKFHPTT